MAEAQQVITNTDLLQHLQDTAKIVGPFIAVILALIVYSWQRMEKTQDRLEKAFVDHVKENDALHDKLFHEMREVNKELDRLLGEHKVLNCIKD